MPNPLPPLTLEQARAHALSSAALVAVPMDSARAERVAGYIALTARFAALLESAELAPHSEPAELFCPAPFPPEPTGEGQGL